MEAVFLILMPDEPREILLSTALVRCLKTQVEEAFVFPLVRTEHAWLIERNPNIDGLFRYREHPKELIDQLRDFLPDYLIDLNGTRTVRKFKNKLRVLDFAIPTKPDTAGFTERSFHTCRLFDVADDGLGVQFVPGPADPEVLPGEFLKGYLVLSLEGEAPEQADEETVIRLAVMTEKPIVVTGSVEHRGLANRIGQASGCAVFPTCGDFGPSETAALIGASGGVFATGRFWEMIANGAGIPARLIGNLVSEDEIKEAALWGRSQLKPSR